MADQTSPFISCQNHPKQTNTKSAQVLQSELSQAVGQLILSFLQDNKAAIDMISNQCLNGLRSWTDALPSSCPLTARKLLIRELPKILRTTRLALSLSTNTFGLDYQLRAPCAAPKSFQ